MIFYDANRVKSSKLNHGFLDRAVYLSLIDNVLIYSDLMRFIKANPTIKIISHTEFPSVNFAAYLHDDENFDDELETQCDDEIAAAVESIAAVNDEDIASLE